MNGHSIQLQEKLWAAAEQLRANGSLKLNEISEPILGLIFLKFADVRFKRLQKDISEKRTATQGARKRPVSPDDYKAKGVLLSFCLLICFLLAFIAGKIGLAPIVGAFAAGLILEDIHLKGFEEKGKN